MGQGPRLLAAAWPRTDSPLQHPGHSLSGGDQHGSPRRHRLRGRQETSPAGHLLRFPAPHCSPHVLGSAPGEQGSPGGQPGQATPEMQFILSGRQGQNYDPPKVLLREHLPTPLLTISLSKGSLAGRAPQGCRPPALPLNRCHPVPERAETGLTGEKLSLFTVETLAPQGRNPGLWGRELRPPALFLRSRGTGGPRQAPIPPVEGSSSVGWTQGHPPLPPWSKLRHSPELWQPQQNHPPRPRCEHLSPGPYVMPGHQVTSQRPGAQASSLGAEGWPGQGAFWGSPVRATDGSPLATSLLAEHCLDHSPFSLRDGSGKAKEYARLLPQTRK